MMPVFDERREIVTSFVVEDQVKCMFVFALMVMNAER